MPLCALGWLGTETLNDYSNDLRAFDEDFYSQFNIDFDDNPYLDIQNMSDGFRDAWYTEDSTALTTNQKETFAYTDVLAIEKEVIDDNNLKITVRLNGDLSEAEYWLMFLWNEKGMLLVFLAYNDYYALSDEENNELYEAEFSETAYEFTVEEVKTEAWETEGESEFISIGFEEPNEDGDIFVDIYPNEVNIGLVWFYIFIIILIMLMILLLYLIYRNAAKR